MIDQIQYSVLSCLSKMSMVLGGVVLISGVMHHQSYAFEPTGFIWRSLPVQYEVNNGSAQEIGAAAALEVIGRSYNSWTSQSCTSIQAAQQGTTTGRWTSGDGLNTHIWIYNPNQRPAELNGRETIGVTLSLFRGGSAIDGDIIYNGIDHRWSTSPGRGQVDAESIITHEVGHQLGLAHSPFQDATMYFSYIGGTGPRTLSTDDIQGICSLYPAGIEPECDGQNPCADGQVCVGGQCVDETAPTGQIGDDCSVEPCGQNLFCVQGGGLGTFCTAICSQGSCPTGWSCQTVNSNQGAANICLPNGGNESGTQAFGEPCNSGPNCLSGLCVSDGRSAFCTQSCSQDRDCPDAGECQSLQGGGGACIPTDDTPTQQGSYGDPCNSAENCESNLCIAVTGNAYCSEECNGSGQCPEGSGCLPLENGGGACVDGVMDVSEDEETVAAGFGETCEANRDCESGICISDNAAVYCTELCETTADCDQDNTRCVPVDNSTNVCIKDQQEDDSDDESDESDASDPDVDVDNRSIGSECSSGSQCSSGLCIGGISSDQGSCVRPCDDESPCPNNQVCTPIDDRGGYCEDSLINSGSIGEGSARRVALSGCAMRGALGDRNTVSIMALLWLISMMLIQKRRKLKTL